jgi:hypothetical protein
MERDPLARSVLTGESSLTPRDSPAVFSSAAASLPTSERARRTPKMSRFRGSSSQQRPGAARPVSLFVDGPATSSGDGGGGLVRSSSLRRIPESETALTSPKSGGGAADLSPQLETALGKLSASRFRGWGGGGYFGIVRGASKIKLKNVNKKRMATARRLIFFLNFSRHQLLI